MHKNFIELGIADCFAGRLRERNIARATDIQLKVMPMLAAGESAFFSSATGTGKTFAYLLPLLGRLMAPQADRPEAAPDFRVSPADAAFPETGKSAPGKSGPWPRFLILAPTYELCSQIKAEADFLLRASPEPFKAALAIGQANLSRQIDSLKKDKPALIVGNPGRILILAKMGKINFRNLRCLAMDEADRLVSDEMAGEIKELFEFINRDSARGETRLELAACSATLPPKSRERLLSLFAGNGNVQKEIPFVESGGGEVLRRQVEHWAIFSEERKKIAALRSFLTAAKPKKALIFSGRGYDAAKIAAALQHSRINARALFSGMDKKPRKEAIDAFRSGKLPALVSSDLAARGLDIEGITHVIALDVSEDGNAYIHRAGRTARAGKTGIMASIGGEGEMRRLAALEKKLGIVVYPKVLYGGQILAPETLEEEE